MLARRFRPLADPPADPLVRTLASQPTLVEQVYQAILAEISAGKFSSQSRLIQEEIAGALGVSRQPVQQALLLLRSHGLLRDAPGRGLMVAPLDPETMRNIYEIRAVLDGLAGAKAAERNSDVAKKEGPAFIQRGRAAVKSGSIPSMITADMDFHFFLYGLSGNPLVSETGASHWNYLRRVMGEVLLHGETPQEIWDQHAAILDAVIAGDRQRAERLARQHIVTASSVLLSQMNAARSAAAIPITNGRGARRRT